MGVKCRVHYLVFTTDDEVEFLLLHSSRVFESSVARSALPMGVAPKAIVVLYLFEYRLKVSSASLIIFILHKIFSPCEFFYRVHDQRS
jgi:hypothetical protein